MAKDKSMEEALPLINNNDGWTGIPGEHLLKNKIDFLMIIDYEGCNPNGDPDNDNSPRVWDDGYGMLTDVCIKHKIRNRMIDNNANVLVQSADRQVDDFSCIADRFIAGIPPEKLYTCSANGRKTTIREACAKWEDVRFFGNLCAYSNMKKISLGITGPVTINYGRSLSPIHPNHITIVKSANGSAVDSDKSSSSDRMGVKYVVGKETYIVTGSVSAVRAQQTGFSEEDAERLKKYLCTLFEGDESAARPSGSEDVRQILWWVHKDDTYSSKATTRDAVKINQDGTYTINPVLCPEELIKKLPLLK